MSEQLSDQRLGELSESKGPWNTEEVHALVEEAKERRRQSSYDRQQRLDFLLRIVKDSFPEVARDLREIYREQENAIYYARRDAEHYRDELHDLRASTETP